METITELCAAPGCERERWTRGFCSLHYKRWYKRRMLMQVGTNSRTGRCEGICEVRSDGGETFYVRCDRDGTDEAPHGGKHSATLRVGQGWAWNVDWEGGL